MSWGEGGDLSLICISYRESPPPFCSMPEMRQVHVVQAHSLQTTCLSLRVDPMGDFFAVGSSDAITSIWDLRQLICVQSVDR